MSLLGDRLQRFWDDKPVMALVTGIGVPLQTFLGLLLLFGVNLTAAQVIGINSFAMAMISWITQKNVNSPSSTANAISVALRQQPGPGQISDVADTANVKVPSILSNPDSSV